MRNIVGTIALFFAGLYLSAGLHQPAKAQDANYSGYTSGCSTSLEAGVERIESGRAIDVAVISIDVSEEYSDYPTGRPLGYVLRMSQGNDTVAMMNSPVLMRAISTELINGCPSLSLVKFQVDGTDWEIGYGWLQGEVQSFECVEVRAETSAVTWGKMFCL